MAANNTASGGVISVTGPGDFGPVTVNHAMTIDGSNVGSITFSSGDGIYVNLTSAAPVILRNLTVDGLGQGWQGITFRGPGNLIIDNCCIEGVTAGCIEVESNAAQNVVVRNTVIQGGDVGFSVSSGAGPVQASLQNVTIEGTAAQSADYGTAAVETLSGNTQITNSVLTQNAIAVNALTGSTMSVESSMLTSNTTAVCAEAGAKIRLENDDILDNGTGVAACGGQIKTSGNNGDSGNTNGNPGIPSEVSPTVVF
jgi:hypothetical protein